MTDNTVYLFNNNHETKYENPRQNFNNDTSRIRSIESQQNPINQWRKTSVCSTKTQPCKTNEKVKVDSFARNFGKDTCYYPYIRNIINKDGIRKNDFIFSSRNLNYKRYKTYNQQFQKRLNEFNNNESNNCYLITPSREKGLRDRISINVNNDGSISNVNISPQEDLSETDLAENALNKRFATIKYSNNSFRKQGAVSCRSRIARLKYNTRLQASYDNAVNGTLISVQGVSHKGNVPYRNNKNLDSYETSPSCNIRGGKNKLSKIRCDSTTRKTKSQVEKDFYFAKQMVNGSSIELFGSGY